MMTDIRGASNAKANRELAWNPKSRRKPHHHRRRPVPRDLHEAPAASTTIPLRTK
jgi:hypothetical protein